MTSASSTDPPRTWLCEDSFQPSSTSSARSLGLSFCITNRQDRRYFDDVIRRPQGPWFKKDPASGFAKPPWGPVGGYAGQVRGVRFTPPPATFPRPPLGPHGGASGPPKSTICNLQLSCGRSPRCDTHTSSRRTLRMSPACRRRIISSYSLPPRFRRAKPASAAAYGCFAPVCTKPGDSLAGAEEPGPLPHRRWAREKVSPRSD